MNSARKDGMRLLLLGAAIFIVTGFLWEPHWPGAMADFKAVFVASRAMLHQADPYQANHILAELKRQMDPAEVLASSPRQMQVALQCINLPTTLCLLVPFALLPWSAAHLLWMALIACIFLLAAFLAWDLSAEFAPVAAGCAIGILVADSILLLTGGNMAGFVISLTVIAVWCFLRAQFVWPGALCLALALAVKPQDAGLIWLYFLLAGGAFRKHALQTLAMLAALWLPSLLWITHIAPGWLAELRANLAFTASRGQLNDPGPASVTHLSLDMPIHLQTVFSVLRDQPRFYNLAAYTVCGLLILCWIGLTLRLRQSGTSPLLAIGAAASLSLLPTYHRLYDAPLLLLAIPAIAVLLARYNHGRKWVFAVLGLTLAFTGDFPLIVFGLLTRHIRFSTNGVWDQCIVILFARPATLVLCLLSLFLLWHYGRRHREGSDFPAGAPRTDVPQR